MKRILHLSLISVLFFCLCLSAQAQEYDSLPYIVIGDISVYESTDSIAGDGIQGHVSFDASTNTLVLNNASLPSLMVFPAGRQAKIMLSGNNSISRMTSMNDSCTFFGPGTLTIGGASVDIALDCPRTDYLALTGGATLNIIASNCGINTLYDYVWDSIVHYPNLVVDNSSLVITAPSCCQFIWNWWLSECHVIAPQDFEYQLDSWTFLSSGTIHDYLEIRAGIVGLPIHETTGWQVWGVKGGLHVEGLPNNQIIEVTNILGQTTRHFTASVLSSFIPLKAGLYLVRVNNHTVKTIVN